MADIVLSPQSGTAQNDIYTSIVVSTASNGSRPVGLQAWIKPMASGVGQLSIVLKDYTANRTYGTWGYAEASWNIDPAVKNSAGYKYITFTAKSPSNIPPTIGDTVGFTLTTTRGNQWSLQSAAFATGRTIQAVVVPEPSSVLLAIASFAICTFLIWRKK